MSVALDGLHEIPAERGVKLRDSGVTVSGEGAEDRGGDQTNLSQQIIERLRQSPNPISLREIRCGIDCSAEDLSRRLYAMRMDGRVLGTPSSNGGTERYQYSLPTLTPESRSLMTGEIARREVSRKLAPKQKLDSRDGNAALREGASSLEAVLLGVLSENFHEVLKSYGRLCGLIR